MKFLKIIAILLAIYVGIVVLFESLLGYYQPAGETTLVITTTNAEGVQTDRVLSSLTSDEKLYVAANHWPRAWYREVLAHPEVQVTVDGNKGDYLVVSASDAEDARLRAEHPLGIIIKLLTGFPPRYFVRLDPV